MTNKAYSERTPIPEPRADVHHRSASAGSSYEAHKSDVSYSPYDRDVELNSKHRDLPILVVDKHIDVSDEEGWITIPCRELLENWDHKPDILSLRPLDCSFLFPGKQVHILACLPACKQDTRITAPFEVAVVKSSRQIFLMVTPFIQSSSEANSQKCPTIKTKENALPSIGTVIDKGNFDATVCGVTARNSVKCFALPNGDRVVLLQANISVNFLKTLV